MRLNGNWKTWLLAHCIRKCSQRSTLWLSSVHPRVKENLNLIITQLNEDLRNSKIKGQVTGRPKHYYSIYQKMIVRGRDFNDIYDLIGVRILVDSIRDCYATLGTIHAQWSPVPGRFKDFIAMPKFNMYQSLHTTVIGPDGKPVEVQIRTHEMHRASEYGVAAHWRYKQGAEVKTDDFAWLRQLVDWQRETADPSEFMDSLRYDLVPLRSTYLLLRVMCSRSQLPQHLWTSPTRCIPKLGTGAWALA